MVEILVRKQLGVVRTYLEFIEVLAFFDGKQLKWPSFLQRSVELTARVLVRWIILKSRMEGKMTFLGYF